MPTIIFDDNLSQPALLNLHDMVRETQERYGKYFQEKPTIEFTASNFRQSSGNREANPQVRGVYHPASNRATLFNAEMAADPSNMDQLQATLMHELTHSRVMNALNRRDPGYPDRLLAASETGEMKKLGLDAIAARIPSAHSYLSQGQGVRAAAVRANELLATMIPALDNPSNPYRAQIQQLQKDNPEAFNRLYFANRTPEVSGGRHMAVDISPMERLLSTLFGARELSMPREGLTAADIESTGRPAK